MTLVDQDAQAMQLCERSLTPLARKTGARFQFVADPIQQLLQAEHLGQSLGHRELIYSAGLFDYLDETTFIQSLRVLYSAIVPGGLVAVGNMGAHNPSRHFMEFVVDWYLIHRSRADLERIGLAVTGDPSKVSIDAEPLGLNLFLHIRR
jgi:extracellular factor (EF) 3-hydroxypalmitic acid methyl ester biosynthesis protein